MPELAQPVGVLQRCQACRQLRAGVAVDVAVVLVGIETAASSTGKREGPRTAGAGRGGWSDRGFGLTTEWVDR